MKLGRWISLLALLGMFYFLWRMRQVVLLVFAAIVLTIPFNRLVQRLQRSGIRRSFALLISVGVLLALLFLVMGILVPPMLKQGEQLVFLLPPALERSLQWLIQQQSRLIPGGELPIDELIQRIQPIVTWLINSFFNLFSDVLTVLFYFLVLLVLTLMLLANPKRYRESLIRFFPLFYRSRIQQVLSHCENSLMRWIQQIAIDIVFVGFTSAIGLGFLDLPFVLTHATMAGLLEIVPTIGPLLSLATPVTVAFLDAPWKILVVLSLYAAIQFCKYSVIRRWHQPKLTILLPALLLLAQIALALLCGVWGLLLAVPIVMTVRICIQEILIEDVLHSSLS